MTDNNPFDFSNLESKEDKINRLRELKTIYEEISNLIILKQKEINNFVVEMHATNDEYFWLATELDEAGERPDGIPLTATEPFLVKGDNK